MSENKNFDFELLNPSGNITALVVKNYPREKYQEISNGIMKNNPKVEQVGFLKKYSDSIFRLEMAGLEFCGNASRAFACFLLKDKYITSNKFNISVSGYDDLIECEVEKKGDNYYSIVDLKLNKSVNDFIENKILDNIELSVVHLPGISHILLDQKKFKFNKDNCLKEGKSIIEKLNLINLPAVGAIWFDNNQINPVVYVKDIDSLFYENSCGSGSLAFGIYQANLKNMDGKFNFDVVQKNKETIEISIDIENKVIKHAKIGGITKFVL